MFLDHLRQDVRVGLRVLIKEKGFCAPAWLASRPNASQALKDSGRGNTSRTIMLTTRGLVVLQILVTCFLLVGALLQAQSILRRNPIAYGYDNRAVLTARIGLMDGDYPTPMARKLFFDRLLRALRAKPEFESAALTSRRQMVFAGFGRIEIEGHAYVTDGDRPNTSFEQVFAQRGRQVAVGLLLGLGITGWIGFVGRSALENSGQIFGVSPTDPLTYLSFALLLTLVAFVATAVPARRATRVDPMVALRAE